MLMKKLILGLLACVLALLILVVSVNQINGLSRLSTPTKVLLPPSLAALNKEYELTLDKDVPVLMQELGEYRLFSVRGTMLKRIQYSLQKTGYDLGVYRASLGINAAQFGNLHQHEKDLERNPVLDTEELDLPGIKIRGQLDSLAISLLEDTKLVGLTQNHKSDFYWFRNLRVAVAYNEQFALVIEREQPLSELFDIKVFKLDKTTRKHYFVLSNEYKNSVETGWVEQGSYPVKTKQTFAINTLNEKLQICKLLKEVNSKGALQWLYANPYQYTVSNHVEDQFKDRLLSDECRGALKSLWHSPTGAALRNRIDVINSVRGKSFVFGIDQSLEGKVQAQSSYLKKTNLSHSELLVDKAQPMAWYEGDHDSTVSIASENAVEVYGFEEQLSVKKGKLTRKDNMCLPRICSTMALYKFTIAPHQGEIEVALTTTLGVMQQEKSLVSLDALPQPYEYYFSFPAKDKALNVTEQPRTTITDRNGKIISVAEVPTLLAPFGGRLSNISGAISLTLDLTLQQNLTTILDNAKHASDAKSISLTVANSEGELLAVAQSDVLSDSPNFARDGYIQSWRPKDHPLTLNAAYHDGSAHFTSGSTLKLITALALVEHLGVDHEYISGLGLDQWKAQKDKLKLSVERGCYPYSYNDKLGQYECERGGVNNFIFRGQSQTILNRMQKNGTDRYGLDQAMQDSLNNYFASLGTKFLPDKIASHTSFSVFGRASSPLRALASEFGFYQEIDLSGGLLNDEQLTGSLLNVPASRYKNYRNDNEFYRALVGEQTIVTPVMIAQMTLAFSKLGDSNTVTLIRTINGNAASPRKLGISAKKRSFERVNQAMLYAAKSKADFKIFDFDVFAKSGTGERGDEYNNAWLTAFFYLNKNPVVIVCQALKVKKTGTEACGPIVNKAITEIIKQQESWQ